MSNTKYRSKFEANFNDFHHLPYETDSFSYVKSHKYTPDFKLNESCYLELKGLFSASDRTKMLMTREQNPGLVLIIIFQNSALKLSKKSKTSYGEWATKYGFEWYGIQDQVGISKMIQREVGLRKN